MRGQGRGRILWTRRDVLVVRACCAILKGSSLYGLCCVGCSRESSCSGMVCLLVASYVENGFGQLPRAHTHAPMQDGIDRRFSNSSACLPDFWHLMGHHMRIALTNLNSWAIRLAAFCLALNLTSGTSIPFLPGSRSKK